MELVAPLIFVFAGWVAGTLQTAWAMQPTREPAGIEGARGPQCDPGTPAPLLLTHEPQP